MRRSNRKIAYDIDGENLNKNANICPNKPLVNSKEEIREKNTTETSNNKLRDSHKKC